MIIAIGTDICDIRRIEALLQKYPDRFTHKTFTSGERAYAESKSNPACVYAKRFAAKEAVAKALAAEKTGALSWQDVEVVNHLSGKPEIRLHGDALKRAIAHTQPGTHYLHISLTDDYPYAQAFAILERR